MYVFTACLCFRITNGVGGFDHFYRFSGCLSLGQERSLNMFFALISFRWTLAFYCFCLASWIDGFVCTASSQMYDITYNIFTCKTRSSTVTTSPYLYLRSLESSSLFNLTYYSRYTIFSTQQSQRAKKTTHTSSGQNFSSNHTICLHHSKHLPRMISDSSAPLICPAISSKTSPI
jgi:hypothetical protein